LGTTLGAKASAPWNTSAAARAHAATMTRIVSRSVVERSWEASFVSVLPWSPSRNGPVVLCQPEVY
jgi:hypothetical protein